MAQHSYFEGYGPLELGDFLYPNKNVSSFACYPTKSDILVFGLLEPNSSILTLSAEVISPVFLCKF